MDLYNIIRDLYTDLELIEESVDHASDNDPTLLRVFDRETVRVMKQYLEKRFEYRRLAVHSLHQIGALH